MRRKLAALVATLAFAGLALTGCDGGSSGTASGSGKRLLNQTITYAHEQEPPCLWGGWVQQAYLSRQVFDSLVSYDDGTIVPWLATSWSTSRDGKTVTFQLRKDVRFTDGTRFDAKAVVANYANWAKGISWHSFTYLTGATATGAYTVALHLSQRNPEIFQELSNGHYGLQSPTALATRSTAQNCHQPVGSGPWIVKEWKVGNEIVFARNDKYDSAPANAHHNGPAYEKELRWKFVPDATTRWTALTTGQADVVYDVPAVQWQTAKKSYQVLNFVAGGRPQGFSFNVQRGPFTDKRVRQAFLYASDRQKTVEAVFKGSVPFEGNGALASSTVGYHDVDSAYPFDVAKANQLLDQAGWTTRNGDGVRTKNGQALTIRLPYGNGSIVTAEGSAVLQAIQDQVKAVGFDLQLIPLTQTQLFSGAKSAPTDKELSFGYWVWGAPNILDINFAAKQGGVANGNNTSFFDDPAIEARIKAAQIETDPAKRKQEYAQLQQWFTDQAIAVGVYDQTYNVAISPKLKGVWQDQNSNGLLNFNDAYFVS
ncbi:peptide/nickel transport system substrate-binding protein [Jatrophihabitans endophyticus]|uniref:Peptide/nickel transport system substrate-binding protein n=1 Tax=Jatrophihabitans endophyticus TaxID=1206085 RepID=A0A1M5DR95_9ACTN|nr:ABC transporter substrate-binding protein [Jatrophihabitans endophyticus]SHF69507.1 peptide/nickel transport system substrate-binding protein [Jatrophihabitans endophyticus]